jgi:hypothetical protein
MNTRTLAPTFSAVLVAIAAALGLIGSRAPAARLWLVVLAAGVFLSFKAYAARDVVQRLEREGQGYNSALWTRSPIVRALQEFPASTVYTNDTGAAYFFTGRYARALPLQYDSLTGEARTDFAAEFCRMRTDLSSTGGLLVLFELASDLPEAAERQVILEGMEPIVTASGGGIFRDGGEAMPVCVGRESSAEGAVR